MECWILEYCPECHGTLTSDGTHLFSAPHCSVFISEEFLTDISDTAESPKEN